MSRKKTNQNRPKIPRIGTVENYRHLWMLSIWVIYLALYFIMERVVVDEYWVSHIPLDDKIPFCEYFIVPYCLWHPLLVIFTAYLAFYDAQNFKKFMAVIGIGFITTSIFCLAFPNGQNLRPASFAQENFFTRWVQLIYKADTNTNVLPSMHVIGCGAMICACFHTESLKKRHLQWWMLALGTLISASTVFVKQHSMLDVLVAIPYTALIAVLVYDVKWPWQKKTA